MQRYNDETQSSPELIARSSADGLAGLRIGGSERTIAFRNMPRLELGRSDACDVVIDDPQVSAVHCTLERRAGRIVVRDRRSKNGVFVNGNPVEAAALTAGARLRIGNTVMTVLTEPSVHGPPPAAERLRGQAPAFVGAVELALRAAASDCSVMIVGETGTGKELVARAVHDASARAEGPFVALNCGGLPSNLVGSELFGHVRGAFTGAVRDRDGAFLQASGGTLFLDELGELPIDQQPQLLRVLETGTVRRVGDDAEAPVDVRMVSATNRIADLGTPSSTLRLDLFHRLATVVVTLPPLRDRPGDIPLLVDAFTREFAGEPRPIARTTMRALCGYAWPGNVRELRKAVQRAIALDPAELTLANLLPGDGPPPAGEAPQMAHGAADTAHRRRRPVASTGRHDDGRVRARSDARRARPPWLDPRRGAGARHGQVDVRRSRQATRDRGQVARRSGSASPA